KITTANVHVDAAAAAKLDMLPGRNVVLTVSDTGIGMDAQIQSRIFEPFFTTKEPGRGTGLGLATEYGIVGQSGRSIQVQSEPNCGTTFSIFMPQSDGVAEMRPVAAPGGPLKGTETILLVEDEEAVRGLTARSLQGYGYHVLQARDGE